MPLTNSPILDGFSDDPLSPGRPNPRQRSPWRGIFSPLRVTILSLALIALLLGVVAFLLPSYGGVRGTVRDIDGNPLQVEVFVGGMSDPVQTDSYGRFALTHVVSGQQTLKLRYQGEDYVFQIEIPEQDNLNIGQIQIATGA